jgi:predicted transcriptional regulator YdeE
MVIVKATQASETGGLPSPELLAAMGQYNEELARAGILLSADGLKPSSQGARVRFSGESRIVTDGPFAETKELIAGFWMWKVNSLAEAIEWVKRCPNPMPEDSDSEIEIRPVFEMEDFGDALAPELREQEAAMHAEALGLSTPTFRHGPERLVAGLNASYGKETRAKIPQQWERLAPHLGKVPGQVGPDAYGVCHAAGPDGRFEYLAGVAVSSPHRLPEGFTTVKVDARRYAVFAHPGHVSSLPATIDTIWSKWAPECGLAVAQGASCFERYTPEFDPRTGLGGMEVWIPPGVVEPAVARFGRVRHAARNTGVQRGESAEALGH